MPVLHARKARKLFRLAPLLAVHTTMLYTMACRSSLIPEMDSAGGVVGGHCSQGAKDHRPCTKTASAYNKFRCS